MCNIFLMKGVEKFPETRPDIQTKYFRKYFIFIYVAYEMNIAWLDQWILFQTLYPPAPNHRQAVKSEVCIRRGYLHRTGGKNQGVDTKNPDECLTPFENYMSLF